jgi:hypothetical protein
MARINGKKGLKIGGLAVVASVLLGVVVAMPSLAGPEKIFSIRAPASIPSGAQTISIVIKNETPSGNSSINSLEILVSGPLTIVGATAPSGDVATTSSSIRISNVSPIKNRQTYTISADVIASPSGGCAGSVTWDGSAWTGSTFGGTEQSSKFRLLSQPYSNLETTIGCAISGQKWRDHDKDGSRDADERALGGWTIKAFEGTTLKGSAVTATDGTYTIGLEGGGKTYTVCEFPPAEGAGFEYRGWIQSVPGPNTLCAGFTGAEPNGYTVALGTADSTGNDFFNVRTITIPEDPSTPTIIDCDDLPPGNVFTVGDGINDPFGKITVDPNDCKPGEYVFETWVSGDEQFAAFYPTFETTDTMALIEDLEWVINGDRTQQTLFYDDRVEIPGGEDLVPEREMLFCEVDANGDFAAFPDPVPPDTYDHTSCILQTSEVPTQTGVRRVDTVYTEVDGNYRIK